MYILINNTDDVRYTKHITFTYRVQKLEYTNEGVSPPYSLKTSPIGYLCNTHIDRQRNYTIQCIAMG